MGVHCLLFGSDILGCTEAHGGRRTFLVAAADDAAGTAACTCEETIMGAVVKNRVTCAAECAGGK